LPCYAALIKAKGAAVANADVIRRAVLIDADNASASVVKELLEEVAKFGAANVGREANCL